MISLIFYRRPLPLKPVTMATKNALFPIFELQKCPNTYLGKLTKFQFNSFSRLGAAFKKPEGAASAPPPPSSEVRLGLIAMAFTIMLDFLKPDFHSHLSLTADAIFLSEINILVTKLKINFYFPEFQKKLSQTKNIVHTLREDQPLRLLLNLLFYHFNHSEPYYKSQR